MKWTQTTRRSHTVPRCYLNGFADGKHQLACTRRSAPEVFLQATTNSTVRKDFYSLPGNQFGEDAFERTLGRFEENFPTWLQTIGSGNVLQSDDRFNFAGFCAFQVLRGASFYDAVSAFEQENVSKIVENFSGTQMRDWLRHQGYDVTLLEAESCRRRILDGTLPLEVGSRAFVQHVDAEINAIQGHLLGLRWTFVLFPGAQLVTSDEPISLLDEVGASSTDIYLTLLSGREILMPLSRNAGLKIHASDESSQSLLNDVIDAPLGSSRWLQSMDAYILDRDKLATGSGQLDTVEEGDQPLADAFNRCTMRHSNSVAFAHPEDITLLTSLRAENWESSP